MRGFSWIYFPDSALGCCRVRGKANAHRVLQSCAWSLIYLQPETRTAGKSMLDSTLVVVTGEFGRTPNVLTQLPPGRQHWPSCFSAILAGSGIAGGQVYGKSDKHGAYVTSNPVRPEELAASIYHALDIPLNAPQNNSGISLPLTTGKPVMELFG